MDVWAYLLHLVLYCLCIAIFYYRVQELYGQEMKSRSVTISTIQRSVDEVSWLQFIVLPTLQEQKCGDDM